MDASDEPSENSQIESETNQTENGLNSGMGVTVNAPNDAKVDSSMAVVIAVGRDAQIDSSLANVVPVGRDLSMSDSVGGIMPVGNKAELHGSSVGVLISNNIELSEDSKVLLTTPQAIALGAALGSAFAMVTFLLRRMRNK